MAAPSSARYDESHRTNVPGQCSRIEIDMPEIVPAVNPLAILVLLGILASIVGAWIWVALRIAFGLPVFPPGTPRIVPWGAGSVLASMVVWYGTTSLVGLGYALANPGKIAQAKLDGGSIPPTEPCVSRSTSPLVLRTLAGSALDGRREQRSPRSSADRRSPAGC